MDTSIKDFKVFFNKELKTLDYLKTKKNNSLEQKLSYSACQSYNDVQIMKCLNIYFEWDFYSDELNEKFILSVAGSVTQNKKVINNISYCISILKSNDSTSLDVIRKFHFDYTHPDNERRNDHPIFHFQYCGKPLPHWSGRDVQINGLFPSLSEPRIIYKPMSLALVLHLVFKEFPDRNNEKIVKDPRWIGLIRENQEFLWKPYWLKCIENINKNVLIFDVGYAKKNKI
jgi:hypothetical protein